MNRRFDGNLNCGALKSRFIATAGSGYIFWLRDVVMKGVSTESCEMCENSKISRWAEFGKFGV